MKEILSSDEYNPSRSPDVMDLFSLMDQGEPSEALLDEFRAQVRAMPTQNPYSGVMINPRACETDQVGTDIDEVTGSIQDLLEEVIRSRPPSEVDEWQTSIPNVIADLEKAKEVMEEYKEHTDRLLANFPTISDIVKEEISMNVSELQGSNPCAAFGDIMGSILQAGQDIIAEIMAALADMKNNLQPVLDLIEQATAKLMAEIAKAMTKIQEETDRIAKSMLRQKKMNLAALLKRKFQDPCLKSFMREIVTTPAQNIADPDLPIGDISSLLSEQDD